MTKVGELVEKFRVWGFRGVFNFARDFCSRRKQSWRLAQLVLESQSTKPTRGITVIADVSGQVSLSKTMRDFILSLREADIPVQVYDTSRKCEIPAADAKDIVTPLSEFNIRKYDHIVMMFRSPLDEKLVPDIKCARIAFHESNHGIESTAPYLKESGDSIIAMSDFNYHYYKLAFPTQQVFKIIYPLRIAQKGCTQRDELRAKYGIGEKDFVVFFNFDFGSYYRKNPIAIIKAFALAFGDVPQAKLVFKTKNAKSCPKQVMEMERAVDEAGVRDKFIHIAEYLPRADLDGLTGASDVYISLHKSEGFGLGMAEAMSQGKPVVATNWSANTEFCREDTAWCVPYKIVPILPHEYMESMVEWAEPSFEVAARYLRSIYDNPEKAADRSAKGKAYIKEHFSLENFKASVDAFLDDQATYKKADDPRADRRNGLIHVAMASNRRYLPGLRATMVSMIRAAAEPQRLVFHIFSDGLTTEDKESLGVLARRFGYDGQPDFREPDMEKVAKNFKAYNGSLTPFLRLYFPEEFSKLDWLLWTDVDVLWFRDPAKLWAEKDDSVSLVWVRDIPSSRKAAVKHAKCPVKGDKGGDWKNYACSGVMLMNLSRMRGTGFIQKCADFVCAWGSPLFADQDIFNFICGNDAKLVDDRWDLLYPISSVKDGVVIHFNGIGPKFNDSIYTGIMPLYEIWFRFVHQVINGHEGEQVCPFWKRAVFTMISLLYPFRKVIAFFTDPIHPWCSDFIQRTLLFSWLRRKVLWK